MNDEDALDSEVEVALNGDDPQGQAEGQPVQEPQPFANVARRFRHGMDAVIELASFASEHMAPLDDQREAIQRIASERLPATTPAQHAAATGIIIKLFEAGEEEAKSADADAVEERAITSMTMDEARAQIEALIPGSSKAFLDYVVAFVTAYVRPKRQAVMYASLLTTAVGNFEVLVSGIVREFLRLKPEAIRSDDAKYSLAEIEGYESIEEFRAYCSERYAESLLRGGFEEWMEWFGKQLKVTIDDITTEPIELREVFQRRHLLVHNGGVVNRLYLNKMADLPNPPDLGRVLTVDEAYLGAAIDRLIASGILLQVAVMRRLLPVANNEHPADSIAGNAIYDFLGQGRWKLVAHVEAASRNGCVSDSARLTSQVNGWIARKKLGGLDAIRAEVEAWQVEPLAPKFQLAKYALLGEVVEAYELGQKLLTTDDITMDDWVSWPLLEDVRAFEQEVNEGGFDVASGARESASELAAGSGAQS